MTMSVTRRDIDRAHSMLNRQRVQAERDQARKETYMGQLVQSAEIGGAALATGFVYGRFSATPSLGPIPLDLLTGLALQVLGFSGMAGKYANDVHNLGDGVLAAYFAKLGAGLGASMVPSLNPGQSVGPGSYGYDPGQMGQGYNAYANAWNQGGGLSNQDLEAMAAMA